MKQYNSQIRYVEARPRKEKNRAKATASVVVAGSASSSVGGVSKSYVDSNFVTLATEQDIQGKKNFVGGLGVNGQYITYNAEKKYWELVGDLIVSGAITMFGSSAGFVPSTIMDGVQVDNDTIIINAAGQLQVIGGGGSGGTGGGLTAAEVNALISNALKPYALASSIPTDNKQLENGAGYITAAALNDYAKTTDIPSLNGYATEQWVTNKGYITSSALNGYATQDWVTGKKYLTGITSSQVTTALGFTPYNATNPDKYIKGIDYDMVIAAIGYTPYSTTNPMGYLTISSLLGYATEQWVGDKYLAKSGGTIEGVLELNSTNAARSIRFNTTSGSSWLFVNSGEWYVTNIGWGAEYKLVHSGNYTDYFTKSNIKSTLGISDWALAATKPSYTAAEVGALATSGGTISGNLDVNSQTDTTIRYLRMWYYGATRKNRGMLRVNENNVNLSYYSPTDGISADLYIGRDGFKYGTYDIIHAGNIGQQSVDYANSAGKAYIHTATSDSAFPLTFVPTQGAGSQGLYVGLTKNVLYNPVTDTLLVANIIGNTSSATKLQTPRTIWGQSFDGTGNITHGFRSLYADSYNGGVAHSILNNQGSSYGLLTRIFGNGSVSLQAQREANDAECFNLLLNHLGGNVAIGGTTADAKLHIHGDAKINGDLLTTGAITMFSQLSMKNVIDYDGLSLAQLKHIRPARFTWKDGRDSLVHAGGIADEVMQVLPEVIHRTSDDKLTMDYGSAAFYIGTSLIKPVVDHEKRIKELEARVEFLENENRQLRTC